MCMSIIVKHTVRFDNFQTGGDISNYVNNDTVKDIEVSDSHTCNYGDSGNTDNDTCTIISKLKLDVQVVLNMMSVMNVTDDVTE